MKKNLYYRTVFRRRNVIKELLLTYFLKVASYPRLVMEVFIRKNLGERYFSRAAAVSVGVLLIILPIIKWSVITGVMRVYGRYEDFTTTKMVVGFLATDLTWYVFIFLFFQRSRQRYREIKRNPSTFDFGRFSLYAGDIHPGFYAFNLSGRTFSVRRIETVLEPALFFLVGFGIFLLGQDLGALFMLASAFYSLSYFAAYHNGDNLVLDKIDEIILNEEMADAFIGDASAENARGVRFYSKRPGTKEMREKVADALVVADDDNGFVD